MYRLGIIKSRRLGRSRGIDIVGAKDKVCNMNCIYCECGYGKYVGTPGIYADFDVAIEELKVALSENEVDVVTFSGNGEPTLNIEIRRYIEAIKGFTDKKVCVITNSTLLQNEQIYKGLLKADVVMPSIDSINPKVFKDVNKPHKNVSLNVIKESLIKFSKEFTGEMFLEVLLVKGRNDSIEDLLELIEFIKQVNPTELHINTVDRLPAEPLDAYSKESVESIRDLFTERLPLPVKLF